MDVNRAVAANLKAIRERRKLSLDRVASLSGVSKSMLGQIERGDVNPTISVLWKIANGLRVSFSALIERPSGALEVVRAGDVQPLIEDGGRYLNYPLFGFDERRRFEQYRIEIKPGGSLRAQAHMPGTEEFITVFQGRVELRSDGAQNALETYDSIRFKSDVPHEYHNAGEQSAVLSMTIYYAE